MYYVSNEYNGGAMNSVAVFSFFMFFVELVLFYVYYTKGSELVSEASYDDIAPGAGGGSRPGKTAAEFSAGVGAPSYQNSDAQTADL